MIAFSIADWLLVLSCLPKFAGLIVNMPHPVMAAALFFNGAMMFVAGVQIVASRPITLRATLVIGFSVLAAITRAGPFRNSTALSPSGRTRSPA